VTGDFVSHNGSVELNRPALSGAEGLASVLDHGAQVPPLEHTYTYNAVGSLESLTTAHGISHTYTYNARNHLIGLAVTGAHFSHSFAYTLNALGHRTQIAESSGRVRDFTYDHLNRPAREVISGDPLGPNGTVDYTMDLVGNRLSRASTLAGVSSESYAYGRLVAIGQPAPSEVEGRHLRPLEPACPERSRRRRQGSDRRRNRHLHRLSGRYQQPDRPWP